MILYNRIRAVFMARMSGRLFSLKIVGNVGNKICFNKIYTVLYTGRY